MLIELPEPGPTVSRSASTVSCDISSSNPKDSTAAAGSLGSMLMVATPSRGSRPPCPSRRGAASRRGAMSCSPSVAADIGQTH